MGLELSLTAESRATVFNRAGESRRRHIRGSHRLQGPQQKCSFGAERFRPAIKSPSSMAAQSALKQAASYPKVSAPQHMASMLASG